MRFAKLLNAGGGRPPAVETTKLFQADDSDLLYQVVEKRELTRISFKVRRFEVPPGKMVVPVDKSAGADEAVVC